MKNITRVFCVVIAVWLAAFAPSALAAKPVNKTYIFTASVDTVTVNNQQTNTRVHFYVTNTNPNNSSAAIGYIQIDLAAVSGMTIVGTDGQQVSSTSVAWTLNPKIYPNQTWSGYIDVNGCGLGQAWTSTVTTGLNGSNETFTQTNTRPQVTDVPCASVACGETFTVVGSITQPAAVGAYALDGTTTCQSTDSNVYVTDYTSYLNVKWVSSNKLAFYYVLDRGWHHLAWLADLNGPIFDEALKDLQCDSNPGVPTTPVPLAAVVSDNGGPNKIKVDTTGITTAPTPPFYITAEWLQGTTKRSLYAQVTSISGTPPSVTYTLGSYYPSPRPSVAPGTTIMSTLNTPTPATVAATGPYKPGSMALLCFKGTVGTSAAAIVDSDPEGNGWSSP